MIDNVEEIIFDYLDDWSQKYGIKIVVLTVLEWIQRKL